MYESGSDETVRIGCAIFDNILVFISFFWSSIFCTSVQFLLDRHTETEFLIENPWKLPQTSEIKRNNTVHNTELYIVIVYTEVFYSVCTRFFFLDKL